MKRMLKLELTSCFDQPCPYCCVDLSETGEVKSYYCGLDEYNQQKSKEENIMFDKCELEQIEDAKV